MNLLPLIEYYKKRSVEDEYLSSVETHYRLIKPDSDLSRPWAKFALWLLIGEDLGVVGFAKSNKSKSAILEAANLHQLWIKGTKPSDQDLAGVLFNNYAVLGELDPARQVSLDMATATSAHTCAFAFYDEGHEQDCASAVRCHSEANSNPIETTRKQAEKLAELLKEVQ